MITKEEFTDLILEHKNWDNRLDDVEDILGITPLEIDWIEYCSKLFDKTLYFLYTNNFEKTTYIVTKITIYSHNKKRANQIND